MTTKTPTWLTELSEIVELRRSVVVGVSLAVAGLGMVLAVVAPGLVPARPLVGLVLGFAAVMLGVAAGLALDSADLVLRGARHVRTAGADLLAHGPRALDDAVPAITSVRVMTIVPASSRVEVDARDLGRQAAQAGHHVLLLDLGPGAPSGPGACEVVRRDLRLSEVVQFEDSGLALVGPGGDPAYAFESIATLLERLPEDVETLLVALPPLSQRGSLSAAQAVGEAVVLAQQDQTTRVELIATLDALESAGVGARVILVEDTAADLPPADDAAESDEDTDGALARSADEADQDLEESPHEEAGGDEAVPDASVESETTSTRPTPLDFDPRPTEQTEPGVPEPASEQPEPAEAETEAVEAMPSSEADEQSEDDPTAPVPRVPVSSVVAGRSDPSTTSVPLGDGTIDVRIEHESREAIETAAALQSLAQEVWARDER